MTMTPNFGHDFGVVRIGSAVLSAKVAGFFFIMDTGEASLARSRPWKYQAA